MLSQETPTLALCIKQAQERQDWLGLADYLEYELVQILSQVLATTNQHGVS